MLDSVNDALRKVQEAVEEAELLTVAEDASPLDFLCAVYRDVRQPMNRRMRAAEAAAPYVHATYKATALIVGGDDFATRLERAIARTQQARAIPEAIEAVATEEGRIEGEGPVEGQVEPSKVNGMVPDRRFRR